MCLTLPPDVYFGLQGPSEIQHSLKRDDALRIYAGVLAEVGLDLCPKCGLLSRPFSDSDGIKLLNTAIQFAVDGNAGMAVHTLALTWAPYGATFGALCGCDDEDPYYPTSGFVLYRLWAGDGRLIYVGITENLRTRMRSHRRRFRSAIARVSWEEFDSAAEVLVAESRAIKEENPAFNKAGVE